MPASKEHFLETPIDCYSVCSRPRALQAFSSRRTIIFLPEILRVPVRGAVPQSCLNEVPFLK